MTPKKEIKKLRIIELSINNHLYTICSIITIITMAMIVTEFLTRGQFFPTNMNLFYLGVLLIYSFHKELIRWLGERKVERKGEHFVYGWIFLTVSLYIVNFISKDYFNYLAQGNPSTTLRDLSILTLEVLGIFIFTRCLKIFKTLLIK